MTINSKPTYKKIGLYVTMVAFAICVAYYFTNGRIFASLNVFLASSAWSLSIFFTQAYGNGYIISKIDERISWLEHPWKRLIIGFFALVIYSLIAFQIVHLSFGFYIFEWWTGFEAMSEAFWSEFYYSGRIAVVISLIISFILTSIGFLKGWRSESLRSAQLERAIAEQRYDALLSKLDPHFLFNSLNVLSEMVHSAPDQAVRFIRKMSDIYRYVLDKSQSELVSIKDELEFAENYLELLRERYGEALIVKRKLDDFDALSRGYLLPMALQLLIENAVKHNAASQAKPLVIEVTLKGQWICVSNNVQPKLNLTTSKKLGLQYLRERYSGFGQGMPEISENDNQFKVCLPILQVEQQE